MLHRQRHPVPVDGCFGCKAASVGLRARAPDPKRTVDHTDTAVVTTTDHFRVDRQDINVAIAKPVTPHWETPCPST